jgi:hypothetical protein
MSNLDIKSSSVYVRIFEYSKPIQTLRTLPFCPLHSRASDPLPLKDKAARLDEQAFQIVLKVRLLRTPIHQAV